MIEIKSRSIAVMQDGTLLIPECETDWDLLKKSNDIHTIYSSSIQILDGIKNGYRFEDLKEILGKKGFQFNGEKNKEGLN